MLPIQPVRRTSEGRRDRHRWAGLRRPGGGGRGGGLGSPAAAAAEVPCVSNNDPPSPRGSRARGAVGGSALGSGEPLWCGWRVRLGGAGRGERGPERNHAGKRPKETWGSPRVPERLRLTRGSGARRRFPRQTCELLAGPRRRRDFFGPDGLRGGREARAAVQPRGVRGAEPTRSPG